MDDKKRKYLIWFVVGIAFLGSFVGSGAVAGNGGVVARPQMDLQIPETTEIALFAFG